MTPLETLTAALAEWDRLQNAAEVMRTSAVGFDTILKARAETVDVLIASARVVTSSFPATLLKGWSGYAWKDGVYVDDIQNYFDENTRGSK